jgi:hypothetical protein
MGRLRYALDGYMYLQAFKYSAGTSTAIGSEVRVPPVSFTYDMAWIRGQVIGINPTTITLKAWSQHQYEPADWQYTATDSSAPLQTSGAIGLRTYLPSATANLPVTFSFRHLSVTHAVFASDTFAPSTVGGWGAPDADGTYSLAAPLTGYSTNGSSGVITSQAAGDNLRAVLSTVSAADVNVSVRLRPDSLPTSDEFAYIDFRRVDFNNYYQVQARFAADGHAYLRLRRILGNVATNLGSELQVPGYLVAPNSQMWLRVQASGFNSTSLAMMAWPVGRSEPTSWQFTTTDSTAIVQTAAPVALRTYVPSASSYPVAFHFDDFNAISIR